MHKQFWDAQKHAGVGIYVKIAGREGGFIIEDLKDRGLIRVVFDDGQINTYGNEVLEHSTYLPEERDCPREDILPIIKRFNDLFYQYKFRFMDPLPLSRAA